MTVTAAAVSLPCTAVLTGTTANGPKITAATFSGVSCLALTPGNLPWKIKAKAQHSFEMDSVTVQALVLGVCGPGNIAVQLNTNGVMSISGAGLPGLVPCSVSGSMKTSPKLEIVETK
jgi:DNA-binding transcriptional regulator YdaS (Cro superfamily)